MVRLRPKSSSLDDVVWRLLNEEPEVGSPVPDGPSGQVVGVARTSAEVLFEEEVLDCAIHPAVQEMGGLAVGDLAHVDRTGPRPTVTGFYARQTKLSRPDPGNPNRERVVVANVDAVVITVSVNSPPLHPRIIDRYLIAVERGGAQPILCVNKIDQLQDPSEVATLAAYRGLDLTMVLCSAETGEGMGELRRAIAGKLVAFVGHSGVGKSSLLNALKPDLDLEVGDLMQRWRRGAHTTTASHLWDLGNGTRAIDTPGIREFGLWRLTREELADSFPEFSEVDCRFRDCTHVHEPDCGVQLAVQEGRIRPERLDTYLRIRATL